MSQLAFAYGGGGIIGSISIYMIFWHRSGDEASQLSHRKYKLPFNVLLTCSTVCNIYIYIYIYPVSFYLSCILAVYSCRFGIREVGISYPLYIKWSAGDEHDSNSIRQHRI